MALSGRNAAHEVSGLPKTSACCGLRRATTRTPAGGHKETSEPDRGSAAMSAIVARQSAEGIVDEKSVGKIPAYVGTVEGRKGRHPDWGVKR